MRKFFNKIKSGITTLWIILVSLNIGRSEDWYWVPYPENNYIASVPKERISEKFLPTMINLAQRILPVITFVVWIVSLRVVLKTKDKEQKRKRIKISIILMSILVILIIIVSIVSRLLNN